MQLSFSKPLKYALAVAVIAFLLPAGSEASTQKKVWLFADTNAFQNLQTELNQWKADVQAEGRYDAEIYALPPVSPVLLRLMLQLGYQNGDLAGALLVGKMPIVMMESTSAHGMADTPYPTDAYYTDFDCEWLDVNANGRMDVFGAIGDLMPDIWLGRIDCETLQFPGKNRIDLLRAYFQKNHKYRTGNMSLPKAALMFQAINYQPTVQTFGNLYASLQLVTPAQATGSLYLQKLGALPGQEYVYLDCHSTETDHQIPSSTVHAENIHATDPKAFFFFLDTCRAACFTASNYLAGNYLFGSTYGLLAVGATADSGFPFPAGHQSLSASADQDWGSILLRFARDQNNWNTEYVLLGDPTLTPHFNPPVFEIYPPAVFSSGAPLRIVRPAGTTAQTWRIPIKARLTTGAGNWLSFTAKNLPAGATSLSNSFFAAELGRECSAGVPVSISPATTLGKRAITVEARDARGRIAATTYWIEIIAPPTAKPDFSVFLQDPAALPVVYYGQKISSVNLDMAARLDSADQAIPFLLNLLPINWPAGFEMETQCESVSWPGIGLLAQKGKIVQVGFRIKVSPNTPVGLYVLAVKASGLGVEKTISVRIQVMPPYPNIIEMDPAAPQLLPGDMGYIYFTTSIQGYGHLAYSTSAIPGISLIKSSFPLELSDKHFFHVTTDWSLPPGHYPLLQCKWLDNPAVPSKELVSVEVLPQYSMTLDSFSGGAFGGVLKLTIQNQAFDNPAYKLNLSVDCPTQVIANLSSSQITVPAAHGGTVAISVPFTTAINVASLLGRPFPFTITVKAKSPD